MNSKRIDEGLFPGDLEDLILPEISIDEFEPKIDDNAMVVAFYVKEEDAANDFHRFLEFGPEDLLDVDVSPAPNENGYYLVFVEIEESKTKDVAKKIFNLLNLAKNLSNNIIWAYTFRGKQGPNIKLKNSTK